MKKENIQISKKTLVILVCFVLILLYMVSFVSYGLGKKAYTSCVQSLKSCQYQLVVASCRNK